MNDDNIFRVHKAATSKKKPLGEILRFPFKETEVGAQKKQKAVRPAGPREPARPKYVPERKFARDPSERPVSVYLSHWRNPRLREEFDEYLHRHRLTVTEGIRSIVENALRNEELPPEPEQWKG